MMLPASLRVREYVVSPASLVPGVLDLSKPHSPAFQSACGVNLKPHSPPTLM